jgi:hypothetical protein
MSQNVSKCPIFRGFSLPGRPHEIQLHAAAALTPNRPMPTAGKMGHSGTFSVPFAAENVPSLFWRDPALD